MTRPSHTLDPMEKFSAVVLVPRVLDSLSNFRGPLPVRAAEMGGNWRSLDSGTPVSWFPNQSFGTLASSGQGTLQRLDSVLDGRPQHAARRASARIVSSQACAHVGISSTNQRRVCKCAPPRETASATLQAAWTRAMRGTILLMCWS
jgi:hypothetical protein